MKDTEMKAGIGAAVAAILASACCLGPVVLTSIGAGTLVASAVSLHPYQPLFLGLTAMFLAIGFYTAYRPGRGAACAPGGSCVPSAKRASKMLLWVATVVAALAATFPYYGTFLL